MKKNDKDMNGIVADVNKSIYNDVVVFCACDRFNYGDLLFPIILDYVFSSNNVHSKIHHCSLVDCDFTRYGAKKTLRLEGVLKSGNLSDDLVLVLGGGGLIGASWDMAFTTLVGGVMGAATERIGRIFGPGFSNDLSRRFFRSNRKWPWVVDPTDCERKIRVIYNAVGGSEIGRLAPNDRQSILEALSRATYLSVRDAETKRLLGPIDENNSVHLVPDSATILSELFPIHELEQRVADSTREMVAAAEPYLCFQCNRGYGVERADKIAEKIHRICEQQSLSAILLPIGRAPQHEDQIALGSIFEKLLDKQNIQVNLASVEEGIFDIMYILAKASLYIGTSLHGAITAQSYCVPHLGLTRHVAKVDYYLQTWDLPEQSRCVSLDEIDVRAAEVLRIPSSRHQRQRLALVEKCNAHFKRLAEAASYV